MIWTVETDGNLYRTDKSGTWQVVNSGGEYKNTLAMVALDGELWTIELDGNLYTTPAM